MTGSCKICLLCSSCGRTKRKNTTEGDLKVNVLLFFFYCISLSRKWSIIVQLMILKKKRLFQILQDKTCFLKTFPALARPSLLYQDFSDFKDSVQTLLKVWKFPITFQYGSCWQLMPLSIYEPVVPAGLGTGTHRERTTVWRAQTPKYILLGGEGVVVVVMVGV